MARLFKKERKLAVEGKGKTRKEEGEGKMEPLLEKPMLTKATASRLKGGRVERKGLVDRVIGRKRGEQNEEKRKGLPD
ncbi:Uncharacterized protein TCM_005950 [Theobroma cacao]|uniref:Uncharacterized protein n=1 Tax=Theobroma cacao TaxID=3641 RepID=A0A061DVG6_THECC|nr:Uncharacterized protein TCM_005950 [Theobroma cacao]